MQSIPGLLSKIYFLCENPSWSLVFSPATRLSRCLGIAVIVACLNTNLLDHFDFPLAFPPPISTCSPFSTQQWCFLNCVFHQAATLLKTSTGFLYGIKRQMPSDGLRALSCLLPTSVAAFYCLLSVPVASKFQINILLWKYTRIILHSEGFFCSLLSLLHITSYIYWPDWLLIM